MKDDLTNLALDHLHVVLDHMVWMSGSPSFGPDGEAGKFWAERARPDMLAAMDFLRARDLRPASALPPGMVKLVRDARAGAAPLVRRPALDAE